MVEFADAIGKPIQLVYYRPREYRVSLQLGNRMASLYQGLVVLV